MNTNSITIVGNVVADPEIRFTQSGVAVLKMRLAHTPRKFNKADNSWSDGETVWLGVSIWRQYAENCAESIVKGTKVLVTGKLAANVWTDKEGQERTSMEVDASDIAVVLQSATVNVNKVSRDKTSSAQADDPWANNSTEKPPF